MKYKIFTLLILASLSILSACVRDTIKIEDDEHTRDTEGEMMYLNLSLGSVDKFVATRADDAYDEDDFVPDYGKGYENETTILNGTIYLFEGTGDEDAICVSKGAIDMNELETPELESSGYFSTKDIQVRNLKLDNFFYNSDKDYYVLAVLNENDDFVPPRVNEYFKTWATTAQNGSMTIDEPIPGTTNRFTYYPTMINATGMAAHQQGEEFKPVTLVKVADGDISRQPHDEDYEAATKIYVQRNVARVCFCVNNNISGTDRMVKTGSDFKVQVNTIKWALDNVNLWSYPVMNVDGMEWEKNYFHSGFGTTNGENYDRVMWGIDPNYSDDDYATKPLLTDHFYKFQMNEYGRKYDTGQAAYCLENTFDIDNMLRGQSTRLVIRCRWAFDALNSEEQLISTFPEDCNFTTPGNFYSANSENTLFFKVDSEDDILCAKHLTEKLTAAYKEIEGHEDDELSFVWLSPSKGVPMNSDSDTKVVYTHMDAGYWPLNKLIAVYDGDSAISDEDFDTIAEALGLEDADTAKIGLYVGCFMYYQVFIPHFLESIFEDVKWNPIEDVTSKEDGTHIADYDEKHLGRYGVVRNNAYTVILDKIENLGSPSIPEYADDDTDDMPETDKLVVEIRVNAWVKKKIPVDF